MKRKLLFIRGLERVLSFIRLAGTICSCVLLSFNILNFIVLHRAEITKRELYLTANDTKIFINLAIGATLLIICLLLTPILAKMRCKIDGEIDEFEDMAPYSRKRGNKVGERDENGVMTIALKLKRGCQEPMKELDNLIGLQRVKAEVYKMKAVLEFEKKAGTSDKGNVCRHYAFLGNPGTGKTTVARIFAGLLYQNKRIKRNMYLECTGNDLTGEFAGQTKEKVNAIYKKAKGGVLFIDEAYILCRGKGSIAEEAIAQLLVHMEADPYTVIIFAGYTQNMKDFLAINPGLASRVSQQIEFDDYAPQELVQIFKKFCKEKEITISDSAANALQNIFLQKRIITSVNPQTFSNGRYARNCFDCVYQQHAVNAYNGDTVANFELAVITVKDVNDVLSKLLEIQ